MCDGDNSSGVQRWLEQLVLRHVELIATLESTLRTLLFFAPARLRDSELKLEAAYAALSLLTLQHDLLVLRHLHRLDANRHLAPATSGCRQPNRRHQPADGRTRTDVDSSSSRLQCTADDDDGDELPPRWGTGWAASLSALRAVELLAELGARQRGGSAARWSMVCAVEAVKAVLKLWLLLRLNRRSPGQEPMLLHSMCTVPQYRDTASVEAAVARLSSVSAPLSSSHRPPQSGAARLLERRRAADETANGSRSLPSNLVPELLHIARPLIYLGARRVYGGRSWRAWLIALLVDLTSLAHYWWTPGRALHAAESREVERRTAGLAYYLLRSPVYERLRAVASVFPGRLLTALPGGATAVTALSDFVDALRSVWTYIDAS
eukprot:TRINITY_DN596_c0_g1_i1.p1 TRINITY_DN596_c0_g1~~TRINITY_DN596_c0_g1_i1.p1  ORF type:complete len:379 (+),score=126.62 TRINITY_DN596_c0_g1_i1:505-1641(+)